MSLPKISIIVPIYNVEQYLHRCVESILAQTYPNIEVVLVDDGSPDQCGKICDEYAQQDTRVIVVHRQNGGLSAARNSGLDICHGEYIGFVDSDDCIYSEMYERLYKDIIRFSTKISFCHSNGYYGGELPPPDYSKPTKCDTSINVMRRALKESIWWSAWTKLYHKSLFDGIRFPEGKTNEDLPVTIRIFDRCDYIAINYNKLYNYCIRKDSITTSKLNPHKFDIIDNASDVVNYLNNTHPELVSAAKGILLTNALGLLLKLRNYKGDDLASERQKVIKSIKQQWPSLLTNNNLNAWQRTLLTAARLHPRALYCCFDLKKKLK